MFKLANIGLVFLLFGLIPVFAEPEIIDPMQPPNAGYIVSNPDANKSEGWVVAEILISTERRIAVVNGRVVKVGSVINGAMVSAIYGHAVELNVNGKSILVSPVKRDIKRKIKE
ncbi:MAG: hypothetical protein JXA04_04770 [Gammaproteobacteria bacterium]|nr:hypothetical protein [Gammaproteobacteria bacterium]